MENKILQGDCLVRLKELEDNSIDSIVTDPPYELGFMGKSWDSTGIANDKNMWAECLRVLKPGGHLLAFSGTRTYHRMAVAIEDAGFEVRDMVEWVYGCLSEDTEILTESGYKPLHKLTQYDRIGVYDITNNIYKWERPQRWSVYKVHQDTAYRIKSDYTDQIVSRNHRCLVEREGKLVFIQADELNEVEYMPTLSDDFYTLQEGHRKLLLKELLWKGKRLAQTIFSKWTGNKKSEERIEVRKEPSLERWSNLLEETRKLQADKICEVSEGVFTDGEKRWICNGTSFDNGSILGDMLRENPSSASYQSRPTGQQTGKSDVISIKQGTQIIRRATVTKIEYSGIIFCPTVSTGAFVARRNDQVFITGNSGFPKSLNIGKAIDAKILCGNSGTRKLRELEQTYGGEGYELKGKNNGILGETRIYDRKVLGRQTEDGKKWNGWGTALKPAHEPICMARKPLAEKTVAENCLKWGTGGINIDQSRVLTPDDEARKQKILSGEVVCNAFCDKHGFYPSSLYDILSFSQPQLLDFYKHIFSELGLNSISYKDLLRSLVEIDYNKCTQLLGVPYDCGHLVKRGDECVSERQEFLSFQAYYPTLYRFYDEYTQKISVCDQDVFPLNSGVQSDILHFLSSKENNLLDNNPRLVFFVVLIAYNLLVNNNLHNHYTTCKNKIQAGRFPANLIHDNSEEVRECFPETKHGGSTYNEGTNNNWLGSNKIKYVSTVKDSGNASRFFRAIPNDVVDYNDFLIYNRSILTNIKQLCGQHLTKKKTDIILGGVIQEAERFIQDAELLIFGNSKMEKFLTDTASTIKTLIAQMTELKTLNVLPNWPIMKFTEDYEKTIKLLKELNTEDVKNAESINHLIAFKREMLELIRDIARNVVIENYENGKLQTENESMLMPENTNENIKKNIGERKNFKSIIYTAKASKSERNKGCEGLEEKKYNTNITPKEGSIAKYGYEKAKKIMEEKCSNQNNHPTVKPIALMEYLIKMVTPKGGIVLDPFAGSGSTLVAAKQNGFQYIGIELTEEYIPIIEARLKAVKRQNLTQTNIYSTIEGY